MRTVAIDIRLPNHSPHLPFLPSRLYQGRLTETDIKQNAMFATTSCSDILQLIILSDSFNCFNKQ